ncbi:MAG: hypothetical protein V3V19_11225 [Cocleimonas sp.]
MEIIAKVVRYNGMLQNNYQAWDIEIEGKLHFLTSEENRSNELKDGLTYKLLVNPWQSGTTTKYILLPKSEIVLYAKETETKAEGTGPLGLDATGLEKDKPGYYEGTGPLSSVGTSDNQSLTVTRQAMIQQFDDYQYVMNRIVDKKDWVIIKGKEVLKKSGFIKIATFFGVSVSINRSDIEDLSIGGNFKFRMRAKATMPNGRFMEAVGMCSSEEYHDQNFSRSEHVIYATAETRASVRAISKLMGMGMVSEDEMI